MSGYDDSAVDVVVLSLDRLEDTLECVDSVLAQDHPDVRLWVLDQGSEDKVIRTLKQRARTDGFCFETGPRTGVSAGRNKGYRMGNAPVIVALDNDAVLANPSVLSTAARRFSQDPSLGIMAFAVHDYHAGGPDLGSWGYPWPAESHFQQEFVSARFCGAGHAVSRKAFEESGGYDEKLYFFGEELDLSWAVISLGYGVRYVPELAVRHKSSQEQRIDWTNGRYYYNVRNMLYLTRKYYGSPAMLGTYLAGYLVKGLRNGLLIPALRGIRDGLRLPLDKNEQKPLGDAARRYISEVEYAPRGSSWHRFRREIIPPLQYTRSE